MITVNIDYPLSGDKETTAFIDTNNLNAFLIERFLQENQIATPTGGIRPKRILHLSRISFRFIKILITTIKTSRPQAARPAERIKHENA